MMKENCLKGMQCPKCGHSKTLLIETFGFLEKINSSTKFFALYTNEGFEKPVTVGDTEFVENGITICPECEFSSYTKKFYHLQPTIRK